MQKFSETGAVVLFFSDYVKIWETTAYSEFRHWKK